jgi:hypothetical protein
VLLFHDFGAGKHRFNTFAVNNNLIQTHGLAFVNPALQIFANRDKIIVEVNKK